MTLRLPSVGSAAEEHPRLCEPLALPPIPLFGVLSPIAFEVGLILAWCYYLCSLVSMCIRCESFSMLKIHQFVERIS
jgi:hypothetical protein